MENTIEIPFGAKDSELKGWEYTIPEDMEAEIKDGKIIVREKESDDERIRKDLITFICQFAPEHLKAQYVACLERQKEQKPTEWNDADMRETRQNLISCCRDWERGEKTTLLPVVAVHARYFLEHLTEPQKPAEWSEGEKMNLANAILAAEKEWGVDSYTVKFLESLRPSWKPSKEQMKEYSYWYKNFIESGLASPSSKAVNVLGELLEQLKKL